MTTCRTLRLCTRCPLGRREHDPVVGPAVAVCEHVADRTMPVHVHPHCVAIPQFVADVGSSQKTLKKLKGAALTMLTQRPDKSVQKALSFCSLV
jgi:hypothetical protein